MNNLSRKLATALLLSSSFLTACGGGEETDTVAQKNTVPEGKFAIANHLIGDWVYIDSSREFYLQRYNDVKVIEVGDGLIRIDKGDNIDRYALRSGNNASQLTGLVSQATTGSQSLSVLTADHYQIQGVSGIGGIDVILQNVNNPDVTVKTTTNGNGEFDTEIPTGEYDVSISSGDDTFNGKVDVNGLSTDAGVFNIADAEGYNFKSELELPTAYGNLEELRGTIRVRNIGNVRGTGLSYRFSCEHPLIASCSVDTRPQSIDPDSYVSFPLKIRFNYLTNAKEVISIRSNIRDVQGREWQDVMDVVVYKRDIKINVQSEYSSVAGYIIAPGHELQSFSASRSTLSLPYLPDQEYQLVMANTSISRETPYSIAVSTATQDLDGFNDTGAFEPNDTETEAQVLAPSIAISAFLHVGDIDYYRVKMPQSEDELVTTAPEFYAVTAVYDQDNRYSETTGNQDQIFNKGETVLFDLAVRNRGFSNINGLNIAISSDDPYVQVSTEREQDVDIPAGEISDSDGYSPDQQYYSRIYSSADFRAVIANNTPAGHQATVNMSMTDDYGNEWQDTFTITVEQTAAQLVFNATTPIYDDPDGRDVIGNDDNLISPGETIWLGLALENTGTSNAYGITPTISSDDEFVMVVDGESEKSLDITAGVIVDTADYQSNHDYFLKYQYPYQLSAASNTPIGHEATFNVSMTDHLGNQWQDSFKLMVQATKADLKVNAISPIYDDPGNRDVVGNDDDALNPGETAWIALAIQNMGTSNAYEVTTTITTEDTYLTIEAGEDETPIFVGAGETRDTADYLDSHDYFFRYSYPFRISAANNTPADHEASFTAVMTDALGNQWQDTFTIVVKSTAASLEFDAISPLYDYSYNSVLSGNNNSILTPGETAGFSVGITNSGPSSTQDVLITLSSTDQYISVSNWGSDNARTIGSIAANSSEDNSDYTSDSSYYLRRDRGAYYVVATADAPVGHQATINVTMTDRYGNSWADSFTIEIGGDTVDLEVAGISPFYDSLSQYGESSGNGDSVFNPGEAVRIEMALINKGNTTVNNVDAVVSSNDPYVTVHVANRATQDFDLSPNIAEDSDNRKQDNSYYLNRNEGGDYVLTAAANTPSGHTATINVMMTTEDGNVYHDSFDVTVQ